MLDGWVVRSYAILLVSKWLPNVLHMTYLLFASLSSVATTIASMFAWGWKQEGDQKELPTYLSILIIWSNQQMSMEVFELWLD
jgi:hypothetical protein